MTREEHRAAIFRIIDNERERQETKWGPQEHDIREWLVILMEEIGEAAQACCDMRIKGAPIEYVRKELVHVAAVAVAALEDRFQLGEPQGLVKLPQFPGSGPERTPPC